MSPTIDDGDAAQDFVADFARGNFEELEHRAQIEEGLRGMLGHAVASVEDGQAGGLPEEIRRAGVRAAQDDAFRAEGFEGDAGVLEGLAFLDAGGKRADEGGIGAESFGGEFERGAGARARFVEEEGDAAFRKALGAAEGVFFFQGVGGFEDAADFGDGEVRGGDGGARMDGLLKKGEGKFLASSYA